MIGKGKKSNIANLLVGILIGCVITTSSTVYGADTFQSIQVVFNKVNLSVNGQNVASDNILYNGTTYVPMRTIANMLGKDVGWDSTTNTASINDAGYVEKSTSETSTNNTKNNSDIENMQPVSGYEIYQENGEFFAKDGNGKIYYNVVYILKLMNTYKWYGMDCKIGEPLRYYNEDNSTLIDNVPNIVAKSRMFVSQEYYENNILPLINK